MAQSSHLWLSAFAHKRGNGAQAAGEPTETLEFTNLFIVNLDGNSPNTTVDREYLISPEGGQPTVNVPAALQEAGVYVAVWFGWIIIGLDSNNLGTSNVLGTITLVHPDNNAVTATLDVSYSAPGGGETLAPRGGFQ
jgi:hypothetical protein